MSSTNLHARPFVLPSAAASLSNFSSQKPSCACRQHTSAAVYSWSWSRCNQSSSCQTCRSDCRQSLRQTLLSCRRCLRPAKGPSPMASSLAMHMGSMLRPWTTKHRPIRPAPRIPRAAHVGRFRSELRRRVLQPCCHQLRHEFQIVSPCLPSP